MQNLFLYLHRYLLSNFNEVGKWLSPYYSTILYDSCKAKPDEIAQISCYLLQVSGGGKHLFVLAANISIENPITPP